jgi:predicted small secreted protein
MLWQEVKRKHILKKENQMTKFLVLIMVCTTMLTACNTVAGLGTDLNKSANWTKDKMSGTDLSQGTK